MLWREVGIPTCDGEGGVAKDLLEGLHAPPLITIHEAKWCRRSWKCRSSNYRSAMTLAHELGMRPLIAHCHRGLGKLYRRTGKREQAQEHLTTATTMYREMEMR